MLSKQQKEERAEVTTQVLAPIPSAEDELVPEIETETKLTQMRRPQTL